MLLSLSLVLAACSSAPSNANSKTKVPTQTGPLSVGIIAPLSGPAAELGLLISDPCYAATYLVDQNGGVMGHQLKCVPIDDTGDPADAVPNVTKAIATTANFDMAVGLETNTAAVTIPLVNKAKIPMFTTNGLVSYNRTSDQYFWRATPADNANGAAFVAWAKHEGYARAAVVFQNTSNNTANLSGVEGAAPKVGLTITSNDTIQGDQSSYSSVVAKIIAQKPQVLILAADPQTAATFLSNYKQVSGGSLPPMITATESLTPDFYNAVTKVVGSQYVTHDISLVGQYLNTSSPAFPPYKQAMLTAPGAKNAKTVLGVGVIASIYDGINVMALAMMEAHSTVGSVYNAYIPRVTAGAPGAVVVNTFAQGAQALKAGKKIQYVGVGGAISWNQYHNSPGEFSATRFGPGASSVLQGVMPASEVSKLL